MSAQVNSPSQLDSLIQQATSESIPNGEIDLALSLEISDVIRSRRVTPKECMRCLKRRIVATRSNPNANLSSWRLAEVCLKNGGIPFIKEICSREFMDCLEHAILESGTNEDLETVCTTMLQNLYVAFKNDSQLNYVSKVYQKLAARGVDFPSEIYSQSDSATAMFDSKTPADWIDSDACMICSNKFTLLTRKHHCRSCGGIFCQEHSSHTIPLPDLGIYEPVRVCDNCYDDYDLKRQSGKKHRRKKKHHKSLGEDEDDDDLRRAIELSLRESRHEDTVVPIVAAPAKSLPKEIEEDDPDLKAAIEASLREANEDIKRRESIAAQTAPIYQVPIMEAPQPLNELTSTEEDDIQLFASLVERMKSQPITAVLEDTQLQQLYRKVIGTGPKLNTALNDTVSKYNSLLQMNSKISDIMNLYDAMLEKQLREINLSQQYSVPQLPSDPYSYYRAEETKPQEAQLFAQQPQQTQSYGPQLYQGQQYAQPEQAQELMPRPQQSLMQPQSLPQSQSQPQPYYAPAYRTEEQPGPYRAQNQATLGSPPASHPEQLNKLAFQQTTPQNNPQPSVTPYPREQHAQNIGAMPSDSPYPREEDEKPSSVLPSEPPYPFEEDDHKQHADGSRNGNGITNFDFPTVPIQKPAMDDGSEEVQEHLQEEKQEEEPEPLLIEL